MAGQLLETGVVLKAQEGRVVVGVKRMIRGRFGRVTQRTTKLYADDSRRLASVGDVVTVAFARPISSSKRWRLVEVVNKVDTTVEGVQDA